MKKLFDAVHDYCSLHAGPEKRAIENYVPHDPVHAFAMARHLVELKQFDVFLVVGPEGFIYSYFFEKLGIALLSIGIADPPTQLKYTDDLSIIRNKSVLVIEDDVIGGASLRLIEQALKEHAPRAVSLYLGHSRAVQRLEGIPKYFERVYLAENTLEPQDYAAQEEALKTFVQAI